MTFETQWILSHLARGIPHFFKLYYYSSLRIIIDHCIPFTGDTLCNVPKTKPTYTRSVYTHCVCVFINTVSRIYLSYKRIHIHIHTHTNPVIHTWMFTCVFVCAKKNCIYVHIHLGMVSGTWVIFFFYPKSDSICSLFWPCHWTRPR